MDYLGLSGEDAMITMARELGLQRLRAASRGRLEAALLIGCGTIPVDEQDYASEAEELADLLADNRLSELAELDEDDLRRVLKSIGESDPDGCAACKGADRDYRNGIRWWQWDPTKWMIAVCDRVGLARNLNRVSNFKIQRAILDTDFMRARNKLEVVKDSESLRGLLEREYQLFTDSINQWTALQAERYERTKLQLSGALEDKKHHLQQKWEHAALHSKLKTLEYSLKMQRKRMSLLMEQVHFHQAQTA